MRAPYPGDVRCNMWPQSIFVYRLFLIFSVCYGELISILGTFICILVMQRVIIFHYMLFVIQSLLAWYCATTLAGETGFLIFCMLAYYGPGWEELFSLLPMWHLEMLEVLFLYILYIFSILYIIIYSTVFCHLCTLSITPEQSVMKHVEKNWLIIVKITPSDWRHYLSILVSLSHNNRVVWES